MDFSANYVPYLVKAMHNASKDVGFDVMYSDRGEYLQLLEVLSLLAMVMKVISDVAPQVTDAVWSQRLSISLDTGSGGDRSGWPGWVVLQVPPERLAQYGASETDSVPVLQGKIAAYYAGGN
jgi:hypothetical protein